MRARAAVLVAVAIAVGCRAAPRTAVSGANVASRARIIRLEDTRVVDTAWLDAALRSSDAGLRRAAALAAGRVAATSLRSTLRAAVSDSDHRVGAAALYALGLLKDTTAAGTATTALRSAPELSIEASWLLGEIGDPGRAPLVAAATDSALGSRARGAALLALARLRPPPVTALLPLLANRDTAVAWRAAYVVARARSAAAVRAMLAATQSASSDLRDHAARGLARSLTGDSLSAPALEALRRLTRDPSARVRVTALRVLGPYGASAADAIAPALRDADPGVRVTAASFAHVALDSSVGAWEQAWRDDTSFVVRRALAESAARRGMLRDSWRGWGTDAQWQRRAAAASLEGLGVSATALDRLRPYIGDADGRVRAAAIEVVAALADSASVASAARLELRRALRDADFVVRANALGALAKGATLDDLAAALRSYAIARGDADLDARLAFWTLADSALRRVGQVVPDSLARALAALPRPAEPLERSRAAGIPRFQSWLDGTSASRPDAWYEARAREALDPRAPVARIETERGTMELVLFTDDAPVTVDNFVTLARRGYFDGQRFHRVVPNFVVQAGDPRGDGNGGPGYALRDELNPHRYARGTLGMALSGPNTGGSQFFVTHAPQPHLDGGYTVFGQLHDGDAVLDRIVQGDRIVRVTIR
ncbi:MAG TPA: peptidylprolyl isomerase [Gemmatimonadaceae bacterium]|nr:peptidylprolyl isomerase [Gemmatimonadaceae bacterium]